MLVISQNIVLSAADAALPEGTPRILYDRNGIVTFSTITSDSEAVGYPPSNMANPATNQEWRAEAAEDVEITISISFVGDIDGLGIAKHNGGTAALAFEIGYYDESLVWHNLAGPQMPADDEPMLFQWTPQALAAVTIKIATGSEAARIGAVICDKMLIMERGVDVDADYAIPRFARKTEFVVPRSERGDYVGRIVTSRYVEGVEHNYSHLTADFFRDEIDPFLIEAQQDSPFFYAMRADDGVNYDVAYAWLTDDPVPQKSPVTGRYKLTLPMGGIVG